jgi:methionine synthase II (cobalamin-independent)
MLAQWLRALPEVTVAPDGSFGVEGPPLGDPEPVIDGDAHSGLLAFLDAAASEPGSAVKAQITGPLTLGTALADAGVAPGVAFPRAAELVAAWGEVLVDRLTRGLPDRWPVVFLDEPALVQWGEGDGPLPREDAVDLLSGVLAGLRAASGVHVCGDGDRRMAIESGPDVVGFTVGPEVLSDAIAIGRFLDGGGWVAWGAVPTDRPVGERSEHWWKHLVELWCDLTGAGCDPVLLRTQSIITPACGLAGHGEAQAERALRIAAEIGERAREQAVATRLSVGA